MKTKQIVVNKHCGYLLTPYWIVEYMKRKGINIYCYENIYNDDYETIGYKLRNPKKLNNYDESYIDIIFVEEYLGNAFSEVTFNNLNKKLWFYEYDFKNREDKDLIEIAKLINDEERIKIIEIPSDVVYEICEFDYSEEEYVEEMHRTWY